MIITNWSDDAAKVSSKLNRFCCLVEDSTQVKNIGGILREDTPITPLSPSQLLVGSRKRGGLLATYTDHFMDRCLIQAEYLVKCK